eukprot:361497-Chlamydomonas_euryale.AAC.12
MASGQLGANERPPPSACHAAHSKAGTATRAAVAASLSCAAREARRGHGAPGRGHLDRRRRRRRHAQSAH